MARAPVATGSRPDPAAAKVPPIRSLEQLTHLLLHIAPVVAAATFEKAGHCAAISHAAVTALRALEVAAEVAWVGLLVSAHGARRPGVILGDQAGMYDAYALPGETREAFFRRAGIAPEPPFGHHCIVRVRVGGSARLIDLTFGQVNRLVQASLPQAIAYEAGSELPLRVPWGEWELRYWTALPAEADPRYPSPEFSVAQALLEWLRVGLELGDIRRVYDRMRDADPAGFARACNSLRAWRVGACSNEQWESEFAVPNGSELQRRGQLSRLPDPGRTAPHQKVLPGSPHVSTTARGGSPRVRAQ